ncbi:helix-turn-helix domain-containing protein [Vallitalea guaymasensis]|uniref:helix-turn-helix domain-containing protein n=1 Tax=Vallitalea guaymasensis TaxID=1185412 RepID=UPI000DE5516E|nr:helix-turn-helix domain-containing protein [Vallitalea guaymasensis]
MYTTIGERIKFIRKTKNLTLEEFAREINMKKGSISSYENNRYNPSADTVVMISKLYDVDLNWLLTGEGQPFKIIDMEFVSCENVPKKDISEDEMDLILKFRELSPYQKGIILGRIEQAYEDLKSTKKQTSYNSGEEVVTKEASA